ncbi:MAG: hypothetical protein ACHQ9S_07215 [Candidatus Binatia bacterium]
MECACDIGKIQAVHAYLKEHFPGYTPQDLHTRSAVMQAGVLVPSGDHHVVSLRADGGGGPYSTVLTSEFLEHPAEELGERLCQLDLASALHIHRIVIVWGNGASAL